MPARIRLGIDTGGTFTDIVALNEDTGAIVTTKTPSTPADPAQGFMTGVHKVLGMLGQSGKQLKQFGWIHEMACPNENTLYVAELLNWRVQKLILHP